MEVNVILNPLQENLEKALDHMLREFSSIHTGKASPTLIENLNVTVESYGSTMKLKELAVITTPEARSLLIQPFDPSTENSITSAIRDGRLGFSPVSDGKSIRINVPELSEERRREFVKLIKQLSEEARIRVRSCRKESIDAIKSFKSKGEVTEDQQKEWEERVQKSIESYNTKIEASFRVKEKEVLTV